MDIKRIPARPSKEGSSVLAVAERRLKVFDLHKAGLSQSDIADALDINANTVSKYLHDELQELAKQQSALVETARDVELVRLDRLQASIWPEAISGKLACMDRVLRIMERRAKLLGLDKPQVMEHNIGDSFVDLVQRANEQKKEPPKDV